MTDISTANNRCAATTKRGAPCQGRPGPDGFCFWHSPARADERKAAQRKGGKARQGRAIRYIPRDGDKPEIEVTLTGPDDLLGVLEVAFADVLSTESSINRARALGYLAGITLKAFEVTALEERIAALEAALMTMKGQTT